MTSGNGTVPPGCTRERPLDIRSLRDFGPHLTAQYSGPGARDARPSAAERRR